MTITDWSVDESGQEAERTNEICADGKEHRSGENGRYVVVAGFFSSHILEAVATRDGEVEGRVTYEVSADGRTLTVSAATAAEAGFAQKIVFDRK